MSHTKRWLAAAAAALVATACAAAQEDDAQPQGLAEGAHLDDAWIRPLLGGSDVTAAYGVLRNPTGARDRLVDARSPRAEAVEIHTHERDGDVMRMRRVKFLVVPAEGTTTLAPGGDHLMIYGVDELAEGDVFPLTLIFETAGEVEVEAVVAAAAPDGGAHDAHH